MVERVARAILSSQVQTAPEMEALHGSDYIAAAKAVIAAMREPTHMMLVRGSEQGGGPEPYQRNTKGLPDIWRDMIDAALKE